MSVINKVFDYNRTHGLMKIQYIVPLVLTLLLSGCNLLTLTKPSAPLKKSFVTEKTVNFGGIFNQSPNNSAKLSVRKVARLRSIGREAGDYLAIVFHLDNRSGSEQIFVDIDDNQTVQLEIADNNYLIRSLNRMADTQDTPNFKIGEVGDFLSFYDLNPGSIKKNPNVREPADITLFQTKLPSYPRKPDDEVQFRENLSTFWSGPFSTKL